MDISLASCADEASVSRMDDSHVLTRRHDSMESLDTTDKILSKSVDFTEIDSTQIQDLRDNISVLRSKYEILQNEFDNTLLENNKLHQQINKLTKENETLKSLCRSPLSSTELASDSSIKLQKSRRRLDAAIPFGEFGRSPVHINSSQLDNTPIQTIALQKRITDLEKQLENTQNTIKSLKTYIMTLEHRISSSGDSPHIKIKKTTINEPKEDDSNHIYIFGTQRCVGLSTALLRSRMNTSYEKYRITAITKPFALAADITKNVRDVQAGSRDKFVICVGENDYDTNILTLHLRRLLAHLVDNDVVVINLLTNMYINVNHINNEIKHICNKYQNCHFIECKSRNVLKMCQSINHVIDYIDYKYKYLNIKELKKIIMRNNESRNSIVRKYQKGTIPYYFSKSQSRRDPSTSSDVYSITQTFHDTSHPKGTIPYYFAKCHLGHCTSTNVDVHKTPPESSLPQKINRKHFFRSQNK